MGNTHCSVKTWYAIIRIHKKHFTFGKKEKIKRKAKRVENPTLAEGQVNKLKQRWYRVSQAWHTNPWAKWRMHSSGSSVDFLQCLINIKDNSEELTHTLSKLPLRKKTSYKLLSDSQMHICAVFSFCRIGNKCRHANPFCLHSQICLFISLKRPSHQWEGI